MIPFSCPFFQNIEFSFTPILDLKMLNNLKGYQATCCKTKWKQYTQPNLLKARMTPCHREHRTSGETMRNRFKKEILRYNKLLIKSNVIRALHVMRKVIITIEAYFSI